MTRRERRWPGRYWLSTTARHGVENYLKHKEKEGKAIQEVPETSTSILIGATPASARFSALETRDGMRWRFNYYTSECFWTHDPLAAQL